VNVGVEIKVGVEVTDGMRLSIIATFVVWQAASISAINGTIRWMIFMIN